MAFVLFSAQTSNADGTSFKMNRSDYYVARYTGTFDGGTVVLETQDPVSEEWIEIPDSSKTAAAVFAVFLEKNALVRASVSSGGASLSVTVTLNPTT